VLSSVGVRQVAAQGTTDDLMLISSLIAGARISALPQEPGVLKFYYDHVSQSGPRMLFEEEGVIQTGTLSVSPGSPVGAAQLIRLLEDERESYPVVLVPRTSVEFHPGGFAYNPALNRM